MMILVSHMFSQDHMTLWVKPAQVNHRPANFSSHRHWDSRDIMTLVCRVISQDHVIQRSCDFMDGTSS